VLWVKYYVNGKAIRESTGTEKETEARRFLKEREGRVAQGQPMLPRADKVRFEEGADDLNAYYGTTRKRDLREVRYRLAHLREFFAGRRLAAIGPADTTAYAAKRQAEGDSAGTINRELALLVRLLRIAYENGKLVRLPVIRKLKEADPRSGFFEREKYEAVRRHLREDLQVAVTIAHAFGWRTQSEILSLQLSQLNLKAGTLRLDAGTTKNGDGRVVYLTPELKTMLTAQVERVRNLMQQTGSIIPFLFPHLKGRHRGKRIRDFRRAWETACKEAGCPGMLRHDFRRTAVRNLVNSGVAERVAQKITGHKSRSVFDRYHIVSPADLQDASRKLAGTFSGTLP
jgi:integrase